MASNSSSPKQKNKRSNGKINFFSFQALSELKSEQPEIKQENLEEEPLELKEEIDKQEEK